MWGHVPGAAAAGKGWELMVWPLAAPRAPMLLTLLTTPCSHAAHPANLPVTPRTARSMLQSVLLHFPPISYFLAFLFCITFGKKVFSCLQKILFLHSAGLGAAKRKSSTEISSRKKLASKMCFAGSAPAQMQT